MSEMSRQDHVEWCKARAREYVERGDLQNAVSSMLSDLGKHPETQELTTSPLMMIGMMDAAKGRADLTRNWVEGFN